jgi:hypothetical protein
MFERIALNWKLAISSFKVLLQNKKLLMFPVISTIFTVLLFLGFCSPLLFFPEILVKAGPGGGFEFQAPWWTWIVAFVYYFCAFFIVIFFNSALMSCAFIHFNGGRPTLEDGLRCAWARLPQIAMWSAVSATVMMLLGTAQNADKRIGRFIGNILGAAWLVMTYFVLPVLVVERVGPVAAVKRSVVILKQTWADALVGRLGIGLFLFVLSVPGFLLILPTIIAFAVAWPVGLLMVLVTVAYFMVVATLGSAMKVIYCGALYQYAALGMVPEGFEERCFEKAFSK